MNTYNVLTSPREDISSNCTLSSLAEHSYCASVLSAGSGTQEPAIGDLFGSTSEELCHDMSPIKFPIEIGDVNLDGFNYTVPAVPTDCGGESMQLETMWGGLTSDTGTAIVEVAATNEEDANGGRCVEQTPLFYVIIDDKDGHNENQSFENSKAHKSKPRRTDYLVDPEKRRNHFDIYWSKLKSDFERIKSRTGCKGTLSASFEGRSYDGTSLDADLLSSPGNTNDRPLSLAQSTVTSTNEYLAHDGMDDHRYAATMLTQNISSSAVRDHQYDEKIITSPESDTPDYEDEDFVNADDKIKFESKNSKRYRYDFIKVRWERTQTFSKVVRSLFTSKIILGKRTGADIELKVEYEGIVFNEENYKNAFSIIAARRKQLKSKKFHNLRPKEMTTSMHQPLHINATPTPLTFILPNFASFPFQVPCIIPSTSEHILQPCGPNPTSVTCTLTSASHSVPDTTFNPGESSNRTPGKTVKSSSINADISIPTFKLVEYGTAKNSNSLSSDQETAIENDLIIEETGNNTTRSMSSPFIEGVQDIEEEFLAFENSNSPQKSPEVSRAREMKESATNTEPNCSICLNSGENSSRRQREDLSKAKSFWIRCNDPFCYEMVHASCVGFAVTHSAHLRQLPAYYCKNHR